MFKRAHIRHGLKALALLLAVSMAACTANSDPTGVDDDGRFDEGERIEAAQLF